MFYDRFAEDARRVMWIANEEAAYIGSPYIEAEHLLLGIAHAIEPDLKELMNLKEVEDALRSDLRTSAQFGSRKAAGNPLLSNPGKRIVAYAAEEAVRLNSPGISSGHLLLGILRESESTASRLLTAHNVDLARARQIVATIGTHEHTEESSGSIGLATRIRRRYWIGIAGQLSLIFLLGVIVANSTITGRHLLVIAAVWFLAATARLFYWIKLGRSGFRSWGRYSRAKVAGVYAFLWLYHVFLVGWLLPLSVGIYRIVR